MVKYKIRNSKIFLKQIFEVSVKTFFRKLEEGKTLPN